MNGGIEPTVNHHAIKIKIMIGGRNVGIKLIVG